MTHEELTGQRFGEYVVERRAIAAGHWMCRCSCGSLIRVRKDSLITGASRRCNACRRAGRRASNALETSQ